LAKKVEKRKTRMKTANKSCNKKNRVSLRFNETHFEWPNDEPLPETTRPTPHIDPWADLRPGERIVYCPQTSETWSEWTTPNPERNAHADAADL
jgi:hypothetical protein